MKASMSRSAKLIQLASLAIASTLWVARAKADTCAAPQLENTVPMEAIGDSGEVTVPITLNGVEKKFLFDTGGGAMNYILPAVALKLGLFRTDNFPAMDLAGNKSYRVAGARNVKFGAIAARENVLFQMVPTLAFDGILSAGTMTGDDLDIDFGAMRLNFFSADHCPGDVVYWPHQALAVVPVTLAAGHFEVATMLEGRALTAVIDTGSPWTILSRAWAEKNLGFSPEAVAAQSPGTPKDRPAEGLYFRRYSALAFAGITVANPLMVVRPVQFGDGSDHPAPDMIIGMEVLRHLHLYYAANEKKIYITPAIPGGSALPKFVAASSSGHAWPRDEASYSKVWDPIHRPH
jgi:predicted aspartyl protease